MTSIPDVGRSSSSNARAARYCCGFAGAAVAAEGDAARVAGLLLLLLALLVVLSGSVGHFPLC